MQNDNNINLKNLNVLNISREEDDGSITIQSNFDLPSYFIPVVNEAIRNLPKFEQRLVNPTASASEKPHFMYVTNMIRNPNTPQQKKKEALLQEVQQLVLKIIPELAKDVPNSKVVEDATKRIEEIRQEIVTLLATPKEENDEFIGEKK